LVVVTKEEAETIKNIINSRINRQKELDEVLNSIKTGVVEFIPEKNIKHDKYIYFKGLYFDFSKIELKQMDYNGNIYYLPSVKGKGKMIKNKKIKFVIDTEVNKYEGTDFLYVNVKSFEILK